ncbi:MAG: DUF4158 domain-containing protein [Chloroflexi bacterium]|nr:DUF4158 domain-containing protein [Acidobacteriota bacterium]MBV9602177.1 DUF4158 domain-containing protein [Chloroflexota bacterium]
MSILQPHWLLTRTTIRAPSNVAAIREYLHVQPYGAGGRHVMIAALADAAATKYELEDLINVAIEQLVRQRFELPALDTLNRGARRVRATFNRALYKRVFDELTKDELARIDTLFITDLTTLRTPWNDLKTDAGNSTLTHLRGLVARQRWLASQAVRTDALAGMTARSFGNIPITWVRPLTSLFKRLRVVAPDLAPVLLGKCQIRHHFVLCRIEQLR